MREYVAVSPERHKDKRWKRPTDFSFAKDQSMVLLVGLELSKALLSMPMAFVKYEEKFHIVGVLGLQPCSNLFITPEGKWCGAYMPAILRSHPFRIIDSPNGCKALGVDEESGLVREDGELFFDKDGNPAPSLKKVIEFQKKIENEYNLTQRACSVLAAHQLLEPWPISHGGLYRVNEKSLFNLEASALAKVRDVGGLNVAYCQMISIQQIALLEKLAKQQEAAKETANPLADLCFSDDDIIRFE
jgi:hypothetical protein